MATGLKSLILRQLEMLLLMLLEARFQVAFLSLSSFTVYLLAGAMGTVILKFFSVINLVIYFI